jgi:hypothetical protein
MLGGASEFIYTGIMAVEIPITKPSINLAIAKKRKLS